MNTLILSNDIDLTEIIRLTLETQLDTQFVCVRSKNETQDALQKKSDFQLIVVNYSSSFHEIDTSIAWVRSQYPDTPFVLCSSYHPTHFEIFKKQPVSSFIIKPDVFNGLREVIKNLILEEKIPPSPEKKTEYVPLSTRIILKMGILHSDLYLKIGNHHYVKLFREGDVFQRYDFERFAQKKTEILYIKSTGVGTFVEQVSQLLNTLSTLPTPSSDLSISVSQEALEVIGSIHQQLGLTPELKNLIKSTAELTLKHIQQTLPSPALWKKWIDDSSPYSPLSHSIPLAWLSCSIASLLGWESEGTFCKFTLAALLHDITVNTPELMDIQNRESIHNQGIECTEPDLALYFEHPISASQLALGLEQMPMDVDTMILQHHERPDGTGFPNKLNHTQIHPLAAVLIVSEIIISKLFKNPRTEIIQIINQLDDSFRNGIFKKILLVLADQIADHHRW